MGITDSERHKELQDYIKAYDAFIPDAILGEIWPELDLDLLLHVAAAIKHLIAHVRITPRTDEGGVEDITDPAYEVQRAAVDSVLFSAFAMSRKPRRKFIAFLNSAGKADEILDDEKEKYDRKYGKGASDNLILFDVDF